MKVIKELRKAPTNPELGDLYFDLQTKGLRIFNGETWGTIHESIALEIAKVEVQKQFDKELKDILDE